MADNIQAMLPFVWKRRKQGSVHKKKGPLGLQSKQQYTTLLRMPSLLHILLPLVFAARWKMPLAKMRRCWCVKRGLWQYTCRTFPDAVA